MPSRRERLTAWRAQTHVQHLKHTALARAWLVFGMIGVFTPIKASIPVLFFISVYANYASEKSTAQGFAVQETQEQAHEG